MQTNVPPQTASADPSAGRLKPGLLLAMRYKILAYQGRFPFGEVYLANDGSSGREVMVKLLDTALTSNVQVHGQIEQQILIATQLDHKNILRTLGFHNEPSTTFLVTEVAEGSSLRDLVNKKHVTSRAFSLKGAYNAVVHACNAIAYANGALIHGTLDLGSIWVSDAGRVKVGDFGFLYALSAARAAHPSARWPNIAPEVWLDPGHADRRADVFSLGVILFELLGGSPPQSPTSRLSDLVPGTPPALDRFISRCLNADPAQRFADAQEFKEALHLAIEKYLPTAGSPPLPAGAMRPVANQSRGETSARHAPAASLSGIRMSPINSADDSRERWLIQKDKLDFGPYHMAEIQHQIRKGQILSSHIIIDMDNGERRRVGEHPLLHDLSETSEHDLNTARHLAENEAERRGRARKNTLLLTIITVAVVVGVGVAVYLFAHQKPEERTKIIYRDRDAEELLKGIEITMKVDPPATTTKKHHAKKGSSGEFSDVTNLGDANEEGGDETLGQDTVQRVMASNFGVLKGCVLEEKRRNSGLKDVAMDFIIKGTGQVSGVKVNGAADTPFANCMYGKMQSVSFPKFNGAKTHASFSLKLK